jgi:RNA polymerase sigma-70 factor (ECF subfamily)
MNALAHALPAPATVEPSDAELLLRTGAGDGEAFAELYRRVAPRVLRLALRRLPDRGRAEDAAQETFAAIWRSAATYRPERGPASPWMFAVARNAIVNQTRSRIDAIAEVTDSHSGEPGPAEQAEAEWVSRRIHRALEELSDRERTLIELAYWGGLTQSEIATRLSVPLGTVKTQTRGALARLADLLDDEELRSRPTATDGQTRDDGQDSNGGGR